MHATVVINAMSRHASSQLGKCIYTNALKLRQVKENVCRKSAGTCVYSSCPSEYHQTTDAKQ